MVDKNNLHNPIMSSDLREKMYKFLGEILLSNDDASWIIEFHTWYYYQGGCYQDYITVTDKIILLSSLD